MDFRDSLSTQLPPRRDDEPAGLRQDILDELGDHLACAYNRELLRGADSSVARQRTLQRFGDPAAMACRLWFDAMKGKIMAQRVLIATCLVVTLASLSLVGLVWAQSSRAAAQTAEANRKLAEALAHAQTTNKDMLSKLSEMSEAIRNPHSLDWNPVKFMFTEDSPDGPPAEGFSIKLDDQIFRTSDAAGLADFGLIHPGGHSFQITKAWGRRSVCGTGDFSVEPGSRTNLKIICPKKALEPVPVRVRCGLPNDLEKAELVVYAPFHFSPFVTDRTSWSFSDGLVPATHSLLFGPGVELAEILKPVGLYPWQNHTSTLFAEVLTSDVRAIVEPAETIQWARGTYQLSELIVLRPSSSQPGNGGRVRFEILVRCYPRHGTFSPCYPQQPPTEEELRTGGGNVTAGWPVPGLVLPEVSWSKITTSFDARPERVNEWKITLPGDLIEAAREKLKADKSPKPE